MARPLRIEFPGAWYHIMNRGRRRETIFQNKKDYQAFTDLLKHTSDMFRAGVTAYCLMPNHYHLLIHTPEGNLSRCMRHINGVCTQLFNRRHGLDGQLFRGRYKAVLVEEEEYLLRLVRYIHHNPVNAGLVEDINRYPWSSHKGYLSRAEKWNWLYKEPVTSRLTRSQYRNYMAQEDDEEIVRIFSLKKLPAVLGSKEFVQKIKDRFFASKKDREVPGSRFLAPSVQEIMDAVCSAYQVKEETLFTSQRGRTNEPRDVAVYLIRTLRGETLPDIGAMFNINTYSAVSSVVGRVKKQLEKDARARKQVEKIKEQLGKGQRRI